MIELVDGDITRLEVDAIVNAANNSLLGGGGVDGAIHAAAGPGLLAECRRIGGCPTGEARISGGHNLPCHYVIHTVGPVWRGGNHDEARLLAACYRNTFRLAEEQRIGSIALPAISTGVYGYPREEAAEICIRECRAALNEQKKFPARIILVSFNPATRGAYEKALGHGPS